MQLTIPDHLSPARQTLLRDVAQSLEADQGDNLLGIVLSGSAGRGLATDLSDMDVLAILESTANTDHLWVHRSDLEVIPLSIEHIETIATFGDDQWGYRWTYAWIPVLLDRSEGRIAAALDRHARLTVQEANAIMVDHVQLGMWINQLYRALKSARDGNNLEAKLDGAESVPMFLNVVFALHGLVRPYNKYLPWALHHHPLPGWPTEELLNLLQRTMDGETDAMRETYARLHADCLRFDRLHNQNLLGNAFAEWADESYDALRG